MNELQHTNRKKEGDEIDLLAFIKNLWVQRRLIFKIIGLFFLLGILYLLFSEKEFSASSTFVPQTETSSGGGRLGGLAASLTGINFGGGASASEIPPSLYPKIVTSVRFKRALLKTPITVGEDEVETTYGKYYEEFYSPSVLSVLYKYTFGLPRTLINWVRGGGDPEEELVLMEEGNELVPMEEENTAGIITLSGSEASHFGRIDRQLAVIPDSKEGTVELRFTSPEPMMSAQMAKAAEELLQQEVIAYKIKNAREQLKFTHTQYEEKREEFIEKQQQLARFRDRNQNISSAVAMNQLQRLEAEYNFAFNLYNELAKQYEEAKLKVSKDTPVFSVLNPVTVPRVKSAPKTAVVLFNFLLVGFILGLGVVIARQYLVKFRQQWKTV